MYLTHISVRTPPLYDADAIRCGTDVRSPPTRRLRFRTNWNAIATEIGSTGTYSDVNGLNDGQLYFADKFARGFTPAES